MPSLLETLNTLLAERRAASILAARIGGDADDTAAAIGPALARIIDGLAILAADDFGAGTVLHLIDHHDSPLADELDDFLDRAPTVSGNVILDRVFGAERGLVVIGLASALGLAPSLVGRLLPLLAPLVTAELSRRRDAGDLDEMAIVELLVWDQRVIAQAGLLDGTTFDGLRAEPGEAETSGVDTRRIGNRLAERPADRLSDLPPPTRSATTSTPTSTRGTGATAERPAAGGDDVDDPTASSTVVTLDEVDTDSEADQATPTNTTTAPTVEAEPESQPSAESVQADEVAVIETAIPADPEEPGDDDQEPVSLEPADARGAALAWLGWAVGAVILVLLLAWLLSTCGAAATDTGDTARVINIGQDGPEADLGRSEAAEPRATDPGAGSDVAPAAPVTTAVGTRPAASVGGSVTESELQGAVDVTLGDTGVTGVVSGDRVTLTGAAMDEQTRDGIENRIALLLGVAAIDNRITIGDPAEEPAQEAVEENAPTGAAAAEATAESASAEDPVQAGTTLNELLALDGVTFTSGSADLTPEGRAVLDVVAAHLVDNGGLAIEIGGHTDDDGAEEANQELSQQRADAVRDHLVAAGIAGERLTAVGHGEVDPKVPNDSLDNKAVNRRIEFVVR